jgi:hypothetical protein
MLFARLFSAVIPAKAGTQVSVPAHSGRSAAPNMGPGFRDDGNSKKKHRA